MHIYAHRGLSESCSLPGVACMINQRVGGVPFGYVCFEHVCPNIETALFNCTPCIFHAFFPCISLLIVRRTVVNSVNCFCVPVELAIHRYRISYVVPF